MRLASLLPFSHADERDGGEAAPYVALRVVLYEREAYQLPRHASGVRVLRGRAWVTFAGRDTIMDSSQELRLAPGRDFAVVSALGRSDLVLEVLGRAPARGGSLIRPRTRRVAPVRAT